LGTVLAVCTHHECVRIFVSFFFFFSSFLLFFFFCFFLFLLLQIRSNPGVQPRAVEEIFSIVKRDQGKFDYKISVYMVEMYLDGLNDLLKGLPGGETLGKLGKKKSLCTN
jgi:hypothetical protein